VEEASSTSIEFFFRPRSIAIVGASNRPDTPGYVVVEQLKKKFSGRIYPVNPKYSEVQGIECYPSISRVPGDVDVVVLAVPAKHTISVAEEAGRKGARGLIVLSGGFAEIGGEGLELEEKLRSIAREYNMRIIGPNCMGVIDTSTGVDTFFLPEKRLSRPSRGYVSIASQSGALLSMWMEWMNQQGIGLAKAVSYGNKLDVDEVDVLEYFAEDRETKTVLLYIEGLREGRGRAFIEAAKRLVAVGKPLIVLKGGKTAAGARAALSHTAALSSSYELYRAVLVQAGAYEVDTMEEMFDIVKAYTMIGSARGNRVLIVTNAGGAGVLATDYSSREGLDVVKLPGSITSKLRSILPAYAAVYNPVDLTASVDEEQYLEVLDLVLAEDVVDIVIAITPPHPPGMSGRIADYLAKIHSKYNVPILAVSIGGYLAEAFRRVIESRGIPAYPTPERAAKVAKALWRLGEVLKEASK